MLGRVYESCDDRLNKHSGQTSAHVWVLKPQRDAITHHITDSKIRNKQRRWFERAQSLVNLKLKW